MLTSEGGWPVRPLRDRDMPTAELRATLEHIAEILGVPVRAFYSRSTSFYEDADEVLKLWRAIESPADRHKVLTMLRQIVDRQRA